MKNGKIVNFVLEISQVFLVFLGVYSAVMCACLLYTSDAADD